MTITILSLKDLLLAPIFIFLLLCITKIWSDKYYLNSPLKIYILPALIVRIVGCISSALIYQYNYKSGDTFFYYETVSNINHIFWSNPLEGLKIILLPTDYFSINDWQLLNLSDLNEGNAFVCRMCSILSLFTFNSYLSTGLLITYFSFLGCWKLFLTFYDLYPQLKKEMAISALFIPSVCFWGSAGLQKDTIIVAAMGYFVFSLYQIARKKNYTFLMVFLLILNFFFICIIRAFIGMFLIPIIAVCFFLAIKNRLSIRYKISLVLSLVLVSFFVIVAISKSSEKYHLSQIVERAIKAQKGNSTKTLASNGSGYDLGTYEPDFLGVVKITPKILFTTIFRPSIFDVKKTILLPAAIENLVLTIFLCLSLIQIFFGNRADALILLSKPEIFFSLSFALIMFFISGFTSFNFGNLVRYRTVALPFFIFALFVLREQKLKI